MKKLFVILGLLGSVMFLSWNKIPQKSQLYHLPFKGSYHTTAQILTGPPVMQQQITGSGTSSHLGKSSFVANSTINFTTPPPFLLGGTAVFTAANGDQIFTSFSGSATPAGTGMNEVEMVHTITGGTGRFSNASGSFTGHTIAIPGHSNGFITHEGTISY